MDAFSKAGIWISAAALLLAVTWQCDALAAADQAGENLPQTTVHFGDLNLDQPSDVATLYRRIRLAAESVCGERLLPGHFIISPHWRGCVAQAVQRAIASVNRPALTAYYRAQTTASKHRS